MDFLSSLGKVRGESATGNFWGLPVFVTVSAWSGGGGEEQNNDSKYACGHISSGCDLAWPPVLHQVGHQQLDWGLGLVARLEQGAVFLPCICVESMSPSIRTAFLLGERGVPWIPQRYTRDTLRKRRGKQGTCELSLNNLRGHHQ